MASGEKKLPPNASRIAGSGPSVPNGGKYSNARRDWEEKERARGRGYRLSTRPGVLGSGGRGKQIPQSRAAYGSSVAAPGLRDFEEEI